MGALVCGIDIGSTNLKVVLADEGGASLWCRAVETPRVSFRGGPATDADALVDAVEDLILEGWSAVGGGRPIRAVAAGGVGEDGIGLALDGRPTGPALPWFDRRAEREAAELAFNPEADARIGVAVGADRTLAKWLWLRRNEPDHLVFASTWVALTDYPAVRWCGRAFMSRTLAARTAAYDVHARRWIAPLLDAAGAPPLPDVVDAGTVVGTMRPGRLTAVGAATTATLLVAGGHDHPIAASAIRAEVPGARIDSLGTANVLYAEADRSTRPVAPIAGLACSVPVEAGPGIAFLGVVEMAASLTPNRIDRVPLARLLAAPRLPGRPLDADPDRDAVLRRRIEAVTFEARRLMRAMDEAGVAPGPLLATGGWSRSRALMELRASIFGRPIAVVEEPELVGLAAALLAARAAGLAPEPRVARDARVVEPDPAWAAAYAAGGPPPLSTLALTETAP